jgi:hypothetical protein
VQSSFDEDKETTTKQQTRLGDVMKLCFDLPAEVTQARHLSPLSPQALLLLLQPLQRSRESCL